MIPRSYCTCAGVYALSYALQHQQARTARYSLPTVAETSDLLASSAPADRVLELSLELLIHEIVEEEATTRLPVPGLPSFLIFPKRQICGTRCTFTNVSLSSNVDFPLIAQNLVCSG